MTGRSGANRDSIVLTLMLVYGATSLLHFSHNALYVRDYPNLPSWVTTGRIFAAWLVVAAVGVIGYWLYAISLQAQAAYSRALRMAGLIVIAVYATFGLDGLDHYNRAPFSAHSVMMNLTILLEVSAAAVLLFVVAGAALSPVAVRPKTQR
jgi:hypothetical protein